MKVAIKWKGDELKYVNSEDLLIDGIITLKDYKTFIDEQFNALKDIIAIQQAEIQKLRADLEKVKLSNIEVVKGLISR